jgi:CheY-like chemotaxis protein
MGRDVYAHPSSAEKLLMAVKILMVDGDPAVLELARSSTTSVQWCDLVTIKDGREAARLLRTQKFNGLVMADRIPHMDGFELIQHLKDAPLNASIPIVMLTGEDSIDVMRRGFKAGVTFFSVKPPNRERFFRLFSAVHGAMESERRRHHRLPYHTPVTCRPAEQEGRNHFMAESIDISEGGMSIKPSGGIAVGKEVELEFLFPQFTRPAQTPQKPRKGMFAQQEPELAGLQKVRATVRNIAPSGENMGMDFQSLTPKQREVIQHYIEGNS